jgi:hypothetical protein
MLRRSSGSITERSASVTCSLVAMAFDCGKRPPSRFSRGRAVGPKKKPARPEGLAG